jgi:Uma2 family endonuclease
MAALPKFAPSRMTVAEFLEWAGDGTTTRFELVDGEPRAMAPASGTHGTMQITIGSVLRAHLREHRPGCRVVGEPGIVPRLNTAANIRIPDLAITCTVNQPNERALPDPLVIIEILSPSNEAATRENVWAYASIPSVRQILLVRSTDVGAELWVRQGDGAWPPQPAALGAADRVAFDAVGFDGPIAEFYADTYLARSAPA